MFTFLYLYITKYLYLYICERLMKVHRMVYWNESSVSFFVRCLHNFRISKFWKCCNIVACWLWLMCEYHGARAYMFTCKGDSFWSSDGCSKLPTPKVHFFFSILESFSLQVAYYCSMKGKINALRWSSYSILQFPQLHVLCDSWRQSISCDRH